MTKKINFYLIEFAINSIFRQKYKNFFIVTIFIFLTFLLSSVFFISNSIKYELNQTVNALPDITIQKIKGGKHYDIDISIIDEILQISGVEDVTARVWGYYHFKYAKVDFTIVGIDQYEEQYKNSFKEIVNTYDLEEELQYPPMVVGIGVQEAMDKGFYLDSYFNFIKPNGKIKKIDIIGTFHADTQLESNDMIVMSKNNVREIFDIKENEATDIIVKVSNPNEIATIVQKINLLYPNTRVITNDNLKYSYQNIFNYKSGIFLALFVISLFTFFIIIYDKSSGLSSEEKREIGILKAVGWTVDDVLKEKFYESFIISCTAYLIGVILAINFVYLFQAPILRDIFVGYSSLKTTFELPFILDIQTLFLVFFLSVPIYIAATIIPSWRTATLETDEVIR